MGFQYVDYDALSKFIRESIATELKSHKLDAKNLPKALRTLSIKHPDRAIQCRYLLAVLNCLDNDKSSNPEKQLYSTQQHFIFVIKFLTVIKDL